MLFEINQKSQQLELCRSDWRPKELEIEKLLVTAADEDIKVLSSQVFGEELLIITSEVRTRGGKRADILALDRHGNGVIIELKRDEGRLGIETQALQYLAEFSRFQGQEFINHFSRNNPDLEKNIRGFVGNFAVEEINRNSRIVLIARYFDESLFSLGEWLSEKGVSFRCISYWPVEIDNRQLLSFSVVFDRSESAVYQLRFAGLAREPGYFWHNIAEPDQNWWEFLVKKKQIPACFDSSPDDQGAKIMSSYIGGDRIIAYAKGCGAVGWGQIAKPSNYRIISPGTPDDALDGGCRHRVNINWKATATNLSEGLSAETVRTEFGIYHPISTSVPIDPINAERLIAKLSERFGV